MDLPVIDQIDPQHINFISEKEKPAIELMQHFIEVNNSIIIKANEISDPKSNDGRSRNHHSHTISLTIKGTQQSSFCIGRWIRIWY